MTIMIFISDSITSADCCRLIQRNIQSVLGFVWASGVDFNDILLFIRQMVQFGRGHPNMVGVQELLPKIEHFLSLRQQAVLPENAYFQIYSSPWAPSQDLEEKHYDLSMGVQKWFGKSISQVSLSLTTMLCLFILIEFYGENFYI